MGRSAQQSQIWLAPLDLRTPPRLVVEKGDQVSFGAPGELIFRSRMEGSALARIRTDKTGFERIQTVSFLEKGHVSPDGQWVIIRAPATSDRPVLETLAVPIRGGVPTTVCRADADTCTAGWFPDGRFFYVGDPTQTFAIPVPSGRALPELPVGGITELKQALAIPGTRMINEGLISPGSDPSTYVFTRADSQRNLFRIPLH